MNAKTANRLSILKDYVLKNTKVSGRPFELGIELTNRCNLDCLMCPRQNMKRKQGDMDFRLFKRIIDDNFGSLEFVSLQQYGEPLLYPKLIEAIDYCKQKNVRCGISTNATLLDEKLSESIIRSGLDHIILAFDGASRETYEKVRKGSSYDQVVGNIKTFLELREKMDSDIFTVIQCIYMRDTEDEIREFKRQWGRSSVDAVRIRQVTYSGNKPAVGAEKFVNTNLGAPCYWLWREPSIHWDGTVASCCMDVNADIPIGNLSNEPLSVIWNNKKMIHIREMHKTGRAGEIPLCKDCNMIQPNALFGLGAYLFDSYRIKKMIPYLETRISKLRYR